MRQYDRMRAAGLGWVLAAVLAPCSVAAPVLAASPEVGRDAEGVTALPTGRSPGKPRPPVDARLIEPQGLERGVPGSLVLQLQVRAGVEVLDVRVEGDDGLSVVNVAPSRATAAQGPLAASKAAGEVHRWQITATPTLGGTRNLSGLVTFSINGVRQAAPFNLPVQVGGFEGPPVVPSQKPMGSLVTTPDGELIDSMPAETTVR